MTTRRVINRILAQVFLCAIFVSIFSASTALAAGPYSGTNTPFNMSALTFKDADNITDGTYNFHHGTVFGNPYAKADAVLDNMVNDNLIYVLGGNFPYASISNGVTISYLIAVSKSNVSNSYLYFGTSTGPWAQGPKLTIGNTSVAPVVSTGSVTIKSALAAPEGTQVNSGVYTMIESFFDFLGGGDGNNVILTDLNNSGTPLAKIPVEAGTRVTADGITAFSLKDTTLDMTCPGTYNFSYHVQKNADNVVIGNDVNAGDLTEQFKVDSDLKFNVDNTCLVKIDSTDEIALKSPINNQYLWSGNLFYLPTTVSKISMLSNALASAIETVGNAVQSMLGWVMGKISLMLESTADFVIGQVGCKGSACGMIGPWTVMRNIGLTLMVMALIIIAFANVLQIDIEQYGMNRMIPKIIISIILAFSSWLIVTFFFDFSKAIQDQAVALLTGGKTGYGGINFLAKVQLQTPTAGDITAQIGSALLLIAILIGTLVCGIILFFCLLLRIVMLCFLLAVAPLAFILNIVPFTSSLYKQWWSEFFKWMFMGPIALVIISLGAIIASSAVGTGPAFGDSGTILKASTDMSGRMFIGIVIFAAAMYEGAMLPMQWGGSIMKSFTGNSKKFAGWLGKQSGASGAASLIGDKFKTMSGNSQARRANWLARKASLGRVGTSADILRRQQFNAAVTEAGKQIDVANAGQPKLIARYHASKNAYERAAIEREMATQGDFEKLFDKTNSLDMETGAWKTGTDTQQHIAREKAGLAVIGALGKDQVLEKAIQDNQGELVVAARNATQGKTDDVARYANSKYEALIAGQRNKSLKEKRMNIMDEIAPDQVDRFLTDFDRANLLNGQVSSAKVQAKYKSYQERTSGSIQAQEVAAEDFVRSEAEAANKAYDAKVASAAAASAAAVADRQKQMDQATKRAESDARGMADVQAEAERINKNL